MCAVQRKKMFKALLSRFWWTHAVGVLATPGNQSSWFPYQKDHYTGNEDFHLCCNFFSLKNTFFAGQLYTKTMLRFSLNVKIQGKKAYEKTRNNIRLFVFKSDLIIHFSPTKYLVSRDHLMAIWNNDISGSEL